jgi:hypothetical protein
MKQKGVVFAVVTLVLILFGVGGYTIYQASKTMDNATPFPVLTLSTGVATTTNTSSINSQTQSSLISSSSTPVQQSTTQYKSSKFEGFLISYVDGWKFNKETDEQGNVGIYLNSPKGSELKIVLTTPETQGYFIDFPVLDSCITIGNTWNRCSAVDTNGTQLINKRFFVNDANKSGRSFMYTKDYVDVKSKGLGGLFFQLTYTDSEGKAIADNLISSIVW